MELDNILNTDNINIEQLQKGLKHIGLNLSRFDGVAEEQVPGLLALFKLVVNIDATKITKLEKMDIRSKLEKILKLQRLKIQNTANTINITPQSNEEILNKIDRNINEIRTTKRAKIVSFDKKIGKVKFYDHRKNNFGILINLIDGVECHITPNNVLTAPIYDDDVVIYDQVSNGKDRFKAINVSNKIPIFIFNKLSSSMSFAYPLSKGHLEKEIALTGKYDTGFALITAKYGVSRWMCSVISSEPIAKQETVFFGKKIISHQLSRFDENLNSIVWLFSFLHTEIKEDDLSSLYRDISGRILQKTIPEIKKSLTGIIGTVLFNRILAESCKSFNKFSIVLWSIGVLEKLPNPSRQEEFDIWRFELLPSLDWQTLQLALTKLLSEQGATKQVEESYKFLIDQGWEINTNEELQTVTSFLEAFKTTYPSIQLEETHFRCTTNQFYIELYNKGIIQELSETRIKQYIEELKTDVEKAGFIEKLPTGKILPYYSSFPSLSKFQERYINDKIESEFSRIDFLCFDLESNGEIINEYAWKSRLGVKSDMSFVEPDDGIVELVTLINSSSLIIGQNIRAFDLSVLANHGATPSSDCIWDTLEVEMLLNPERFSYGLDTQHSATSDTELTYRLFKNQLSRIIVSQDSLDVVKELLPSKAIEAITQISQNSIWRSLDDEYFAKQSNTFFRPNPTNQNISEQTFNQLADKLKEEGNKVVVAPEFLWNTLSHQFDFAFFSENKSLGLCLNKEKIVTKLGDDKLLQAILSRFVDLYISKGLQPYFQHLPIAIRLKLTTEQVTLICDNIEIDFENFNLKPICIKPTDIEILKQHGNQFLTTNVIVIGNELNNLTSKLQLGQDCKIR